MTWRAQTTIYSDSTDLVLVELDGDRMWIAEPVEFTLKEYPRHTPISAPTLRLPGKQGQELLQALWDAGLRPNDGAGSGAEAAALKAHIKFAEGVTGALLGRLQSDSTAP